MARNPRLRALLTCAFLFGLTASAIRAQTGPDFEIETLEQLAEERYAEGDLSGAARIYRDIADRHSGVRDQARALFTAAWLLHLDEEPHQALDSMTRSLRLDPDQPFDPTLYNREFELLYQQALDVARRARRRDAAQKIQDAITELEAGRESAARSHFEEALLLHPDNPTAVYNLALLDLQSGARQQALTDFERVVALTYRETGAEMSQIRAKAQASIGVIYHLQGRNGDAEQAFLEATRADPLESTAWKNLGLIRLQQDQPATAIAPLERAHELMPDDREVTLALARGLVGAGRTGQAVATLKSDLQRRPDDAEMWLQLGRLEASRGAPREAVYAFDRCISADGENRAGVAATAANELAMIHLQQGDAGSAKAAADRAVRWDESDPESWTLLGRAQLAGDETGPAVHSLGRAAELEPTSVELLIELGRALTTAHQLLQAEAVYLRAQSLDPGSPTATAELAAVRSQLATERAIAAGKVKAPRPIAPKKIGLEFAGLDYKDLHLRGALVKQVNKKSPAARAGLRKGDLILWIGDYAVLSGKDFLQYLKRRPPGDSLDIEYLRDGRIHAAALQLR